MISTYWNRIDAGRYALGTMGGVECCAATVIRVTERGLYKGESTRTSWLWRIYIGGKEVASDYCRTLDLAIEEAEDELEARGAEL